MRSLQILIAFLLCIIVCKCDLGTNEYCVTYSVPRYVCYCDNDTSCSNEEFDCGNSSCTIFCDGSDSCQNLTVKFKDPISFRLECVGKNACQNMQIYGPWEIISDPTPWTPTEPNKSYGGLIVGIIFIVIGLIAIGIFCFLMYKQRRSNNGVRLVDNDEIFPL
jgi:hypothetical protein